MLNLDDAERYGERSKLFDGLMYIAHYCEWCAYKVTKKSQCID